MSEGGQFLLSLDTCAVELAGYSRSGGLGVMLRAPQGGISEVRAAQLDRHYSVNIRAAVLLCAEFVRHQKPDRTGRIINITSGQGRGPMPGELAYAVTKAGLDALTLTLAAELTSFGISVNAIDPGPTDTGWIPDDLRSRLVHLSPTGRIASPGDVAALVRLLSGGEAATITGRIIRVQPDGVAKLTEELTNPTAAPDGRE